MRKYFLMSLILVSGTLWLSAQDTLKVMTYNLLKYGITMSGCTNPISTKNIHLKTIIEDTRPDVFVVNELATNSLYAENILVNVMKVVNPDYERAAFTDVAQSDETNMLYYNSAKLGLRSQSVIAHPLRDIDVYTMYYKDANLATTQDTIFMNFIAVHLKAGSTAPDQTQRQDQAQMIMTFMAAEGNPGNYFVMGDFNVYTSSETCYQTFVANPNLDIRFYDPISSPGSWNNTSSFAAIHTQSTRIIAESDCGSTGGMDDRFDFILATDYVIQGTDRVKYVTGSYGALGQDGLRFNQTINSPTNTLVSASVANALYAMSDHLPVVLKVKVEGTQVGINSGTNAMRPFFSVHQISEKAGENIQLMIDSNWSKDLNTKLIVSDFSGRVVLESEMTVIPGTQRVELKSESFSKGIYFGTFLSETGQSVRIRLLKY